MIKSRDRSQNAENKRNEIIKRKQIFETFIACLFSQFESVKMKTTLNNQKNVLFEIKNVVHRADLASERKRERKRERSREQERRRERESTVAVEQREILISAVEEERERDRKWERSRERERRDRDREQAESKET